MGRALPLTFRRGEDHRGHSVKVHVLQYDRAQLGLRHTLGLMVPHIGTHGALPAYTVRGTSAHVRKRHDCGVHPIVSPSARAIVNRISYSDQFLALTAEEVSQMPPLAEKQG